MESKKEVMRYLHRKMDLFLMLLTFLSVYLGGVESVARTCYFGPPPKPVPGQHWMKTALQEIRQRCPGHHNQQQKTRAVVCSKEEPLGMEDGRIADSSLTASSIAMNRADHGPLRARLNIEGTAAAWVADRLDSSPWIQVDFNTDVCISGLITQGRADYSEQWVSEYQVAISKDGNSWDRIMNNDGTPTQFPGNRDRNSHVVTKFKTAVITRFMRILPTQCNAYCSIRFEVLGSY